MKYIFTEIAKQSIELLNIDLQKFIFFVHLQTLYFMQKV